MRKLILFCCIFGVSLFVQAQTYTILSRSNDTIRLYPNKLGETIKAIVPGKLEVENNYRLIEKIDNGKKSLLFVEFTQVLDKVFVVYETDLIHAGEWIITAYSFNDVYNSVRRENGIRLSGQLLGMNIEIYQRPDIFKDILNIDGIEFPSPTKISLFENKLAQDIQGKRKDKGVAEIESTKKEVIRFEEADEQTKIDMYYIAYLIKVQLFDSRYQKDLKESYYLDDINNLVEKYTDKELSNLSKGRSKDVLKYRL